MHLRSSGSYWSTKASSIASASQDRFLDKTTYPRTILSSYFIICHSLPIGVKNLFGQPPRGRAGYRAVTPSRWERLQRRPMPNATPPEKTFVFQPSSSFFSGNDSSASIPVRPIAGKNKRGLRSISALLTRKENYRAKRAWQRRNFEKSVHGGKSFLGRTPRLTSILAP